MLFRSKKKKKTHAGFPGGTVVENLPASAGDTGSSPGLGGYHVPRSGWAREPQLLSLRVWSLCSAARGAAIVRGPRTAMKSGPRLPQLEKALAQRRRPNTAINKLTNKQTNNNNKKDTCIPMFIAALFTIARSWKQPKCPPTDEWIKKLWYIYTMEYYSAIKINELSSHEKTWRKLKCILLSERSHSGKLHTI